MGDNIIDYCVGVIGVLLFGGISLFLVYHMIIGNQHQTPELTIDELGIKLKSNNNINISWNDIESIRKIFIYRGKIPQLSIRLNDTAKKIFFEGLKYKWLYYPDRWLGAGDVNIMFNVFEPNIEHAIVEIKKYYKGQILEDKYIS